MNESVHCIISSSLSMPSSSLRLLNVNESSHLLMYLSFHGWKVASPHALVPAACAGHAGTSHLLHWRAVHRRQTWVAQTSNAVLPWHYADTDKHRRWPLHPTVRGGGVLAGPASVYRERCRSVSPLRHRRRCFISCCEWIVNKQRPTSIGVVLA